MKLQRILIDERFLRNKFRTSNIFQIKLKEIQLLSLGQCLQAPAQITAPFKQMNGNGENTWEFCIYVHSAEIGSCLGIGAFTYFIGIFCKNDL